MVSLSEFEKAFYSEKELVDIYQADEKLARQEAEQEKAEAEYAARPLQKKNWVKELYELFEKEDFDTLSVLNEHIAALVKVRETFPDDGCIKALCEYHIRIDQAEIENTMEDIEYDRRQIEATARI